MVGYILNLLILVSISGILAASLNFIIGYAGIYSMAHAAFFGIAAYTGALIALHVTTSLLVAVPVAMAICAALSLVISLPSLRVRGEYFVVASLGLQMIAFTVFSEWKEVTGGLGGLTGVPVATLFGWQLRSLGSFLAVSLVCLAFVTFVIFVLVRTSFGRNLKAIRDNEVAASAFGKNAILIKTIAVAISSALCAIAGVLYAFHVSFVNPETFTVDRSVLIMAMIIIGGTGTVFGPILGALIIHLLPAGLTYLTFLPARDLASLQQIIYGAAMVLLMLYRPSGLIGRANIKDTWVEMSDPVLRLKGVNKRFGGVVAANDVDLDLPPGIVTALVGPNGAGKTTLFNLITGNLKPDSGLIELRGQSLADVDPRGAAGRGIARSFQDLRLFEQMTVFENVLSVMERSALPWQPGGRAAARERSAKADATLDLVGLTGWRNARAIDLGYAEQKFLSLARILVTDASLWLLDEPASGLDPASYDRFVKLVRDRLKDGITICLIEHNLDIVQGISDRIAFLDQGTVLACGEPRAILNDPKLAAIYFGERR